MDQLAKLFELYKRLIDAKFYGEVYVKMEAGKIVIAKKTESIKF